MALVPLTGLFAERYMIERELGHGATAVVYLAHDNKHDREIALKVLSKDLAHALGPQRFLQEIHLTARLHHPHILPIFDSGEWNGLLYYVLPFVRGESLRQRIDRDNQLPIEECVRITCEVADALSHAHSQGVIHRDVKPENIMLSDGHALLADFGIARALDVHTGERLTSSGLIVGTSAYMSPEQAAGEEKIDARSDIYSLACVLYEMIAGVQAFTGPTTQSVIAQRFKHTPRPVSTYRPQVPEYVEHALEKALAIAPADRYAKIKDFSDDLTETPRDIRDRRRSPIRRAIHGRQKAFGFAAAAIVALTAAFVAVNPPGNWRSPFAHTALDSTKYIVIPSPSPGHADIGDKDVDAAAKLDRELKKWVGLELVDPESIKDVLLQKRQMQNGEAFDLAKRYGAGRLVRTNSAGDAAVFDVATANVLNDVSADDLKGAANPYAATALKLLASKDRPSSADGGDGLTRSMAAWRAYAEGHRALAHNDIAGAVRNFRSASSLDPAFYPAHLWNAQMMEWTAATDTASWGAEAQRAETGSSRFSSRDRLLSTALAAMSRHDFPVACAAYRKLLATDSTDFAGWLGLGECQRLDRMILPSRSSPSGFRFRSSYQAASIAYQHAVQSSPAAYDLIGATRMRDVKPMESTKIHRSGTDSTGQMYGAWVSLEHDTIAYVPYTLPTFAAMLPSASRRSAIERNLAELLGFATSWTRAVPESPQAYEALASALEARGQIDNGASGSVSASGALANALRLSSNKLERARLVSSEIRLRIKRGEYSSARLLTDSVLRAEPNFEEAVAEELIGPALMTGRISTGAKLALATSTIPSDANSIRVAPQVGEVLSRLFAHAAIGDCGPRVEQLRTELDQRMTSYFSEKERSVAVPVLLSRIESMLTPCTNGQSALRIQTPDRLGRLQQAYARGDVRRVRMMFDSLAVARRFARPGDLSLDYTFQEAWLRAAAHDTAGAIRQLDETLEALPSVSARAFREFGGAAALGRAFMLRAELAHARGDVATARRYARAVSELWAEADADLQPQVARMRAMAASSK